MEGHGDLLPNSPLKLGWAIFWQYAAIGSLPSFLPKYYAGLGLTASDIALIFGLQAGATLLVSQFWGYLADTRFHRRSMMLWMTLASSLILALFPLLPPNIWAVGGAISLFAIFSSPRLMLTNALVLHSRRGEELYGPIRLVGSVSFAAAILATGWLADLPALGIAVIFPVTALIELAFVLAILPLVDEVPGHRPGRPKVGFMEAQRRLVNNPVIPRFLLFVFIIQFFHMPGGVMQLKMLDDLGASSLFAAKCVAVAAGVEIAAFAWGKQIVARFHLMPLFLLVPMVLAVRWFFIAGNPTPMAILLSNVLHVITFGLCYQCSIMLVNRETPADLKSSGQTVFGIVYSSLSNLLGSAASAAFLWVLIEKFGMSELAALRAFFVAGGVGVLLAVWAWGPMHRAYRERHGRRATDVNIELPPA